MDGDERRIGGDSLEPASHRVVALLASPNEFYAHESEIGPEFGLHVLQHVRRDDEDRLGHILAIDKQLQRPQKQWLIVDLREDLILVAAKPFAASRRQYDHAHLGHRWAPKSGQWSGTSGQWKTNVCCTHHSNSSVASEVGHES